MTFPPTPHKERGENQKEEKHQQTPPHRRGEHEKNRGSPPEISTERKIRK